MSYIFIIFLLLIFYLSIKNGGINVSAKRILRKFDKKED